MVTICVLLALSTIRATDVARYTSVPSHLAPRASRLDTIDRIMAVVSGQPITLSDVNAALTFQLVEPPPAGADRIKIALDRVIDRALMLSEVDRYQPPEPAPDTINEQLTAIREKLGARFGTELKATGISEDALRREIRNNIRLQIYMNQRFSGSEGQARARLVSDWVEGLRRRAAISVLYLGA